jgi:hypothetical protein
LSTAEELKAVHSAQSVAALYRTARDKESNLSNAPQCDVDSCIPKRKAAGQFSFSSNVANIGLVIPAKLKKDGAIIRVCRDCSNIAQSKGLSIVPLGTPIISIQEDSEGTRLEAKAAISKLPYMHRNPAV